MVQFVPKPVPDEVNVSQAHPLGELAKLLLGSLTLFVAVYVVLGWVVDLVVPRISPAMERQLAPIFVEMFKGESGDPKEERRLKAMLADLADAYPDAPFDFELRLVDSDEVNAISLPGGQIVVFSGMLQAVRSDDELAFVLAHELGHYHNRDHLRGLGRALIVMVMATAVLGEQNVISEMMAKSVHLTELQFSKKQEIEADLFALSLLHEAGYPLEGGLQFFKRMNALQESNWMTDFLSTHPANAERLAIQEKTIAEQYGEEE